MTYAKLKNYTEAINAAKRADIPKTWIELNWTCIRAKEFTLAQECGIKVIQSPDRLQKICANYEKFGYYEHLINLLCAGQIEYDRKQTNISTELAIRYARYNEEQ